MVPEPLVIAALELARNPDVFAESETLGMSPPPHPLCLPEPSRWLWNVSEFENQWPADEPPPAGITGELVADLELFPSFYNVTQRSSYRHRKGCASE